MTWHARSRYVLVDGHRAHVVDAGQGPPVLLLHGFLHSSYTWRATVEALSADHRVIVPDLRGFGWGHLGAGDYSLSGFVRWVEGVLTALGITSLHAAIGNSLGGGILLHLAADDPLRFPRLVLVSPLGMPLRMPGLLPLRLLGASAFGSLYRATAGNPGFIRHALGMTAYRRRPVDAEVLRGFTHLGWTGSHQAAVETARHLTASSEALAGRLADVRSPTLLVWGAHDRVLPLRYGQRLAERLTSARLEVFEDCSHCAHEEHPERFHSALRAFLAEHGDRAEGAPPDGERDAA